MIFLIADVVCYVSCSTETAWRIIRVGVGCKIIAVCTVDGAICIWTIARRVVRSQGNHCVVGMSLATHDPDGF